MKPKEFIGIACGILGIFAMIASIIMAPYLPILVSISLLILGLLLELLNLYLLTREIR